MGKKLRDLIKDLQEIERQAGGDDEVIVTGICSARSEIEGVSRVRNDKTSHVEIQTNLG